METKSIFLLSLVVVFISFDIILGKYILNQGVAPVALAISRTLLATVLIFVFVISSKHKKYLHFDRKYLVDLAIIGVSVAGLASLLGTIGLQFTTATNLAFLRLTPFVIAVLSYIILKERLPSMFWILLFTVFVGIWLLSTGGKIESLNKGDALILLSTFFYGFGGVWAKRTMKNVKPIVVAVGRFFFGGLFLIPFLFVFGLSQVYTLNYALFWIVISAVLEASWVSLSFVVMEKEGPSLTNTFMRASLPIVAVLAFFLLGERLTPIQIIGAIIIFFSVLGVSRMKAKYVNG